MAETKVHYHAGADGSGPANPPPYTSGPAPGTYPYPPGPGPTIVQPAIGVVPVPVMMVSQMGPNPTRITCKSCNAEIVTRTQTEATTKTHLFAALLCVLGCWCCCCIPYCVDSCMSTNHYCPNCNAYLGSFSS